MNTSTLSNNLKRLRLQKKYTQEYVANSLGVSSHTVSRWECNKTLPDVTMLPEIAKLYCVSIDDLYKETSTAYKNYAQKLAAVFESTHKPEDFISADLEFRQLEKDNGLTLCDMFNYGIIHQLMIYYCVKKAMYWFDKALEKGSDDDEFYYWKTRMQKMKLCSFLGNSENIIKEQKQIVSDNTEDVNERCLLIAAYIFADDYETAYKEFLSAITQFPNEWQLYIHGGDICKKLKSMMKHLIIGIKQKRLVQHFLTGNIQWHFVMRN